MRRAERARGVRALALITGRTVGASARPAWRWPSRAARVASAVLPAVLALSGAGCARAPVEEWAAVREVTPEFLLEQDARQPALAADEHGRVALTWATMDSAGTDLWLSISTDGGNTFAPALQVNVVAGGAVSFPESRPLAVFGPGGRLAITWCEKRPGQPEATDVLVRASGDGGVTLGPAVVVNDDVTDKRASFHGFPALTYLPDGALLAVWMDERDQRRPPGGGEPSSGALFYALSRDGGGTWSDNRMLTDRACPCCRASAASDSLGRIAVAYRAAGGNLRDPALAISQDRGETFGLDTLFSADGWNLEGCPAVGPALTWGPGGGQYVWYTEGGAPGVYAAPWTPEQGRTGVRRPLTDGLLDASHPRATPIGAATLIAVEARPRADSAARVLAVRALDGSGALTPWTFLGAGVENGWIAGVAPGAALACWTERHESGSRVRLVQLVQRPRSPA